MCISINFSVATFLAATAACVECAFATLKSCGLDHACETRDYCNDIDSQCWPCERICTEGKPNYDREHCEEKCKDYIHKSYVANIMILVWICIAVTVISMLLLILTGAYFFIWRKRKAEDRDSKTKTETNPDICKQPAESLENIQVDVKITETEAPPKREREPSESEIQLEFCYDNPGLSASPVNTLYNSTSPDKAQVQNEENLRKISSKKERQPSESGFPGNYVYEQQPVRVIPVPNV